MNVKAREYISRQCMAAQSEINERAKGIFIGIGIQTLNFLQDSEPRIRDDSDFIFYELQLKKLAEEAEHEPEKKRNQPGRENAWNQFFHRKTGA